MPRHHHSLIPLVLAFATGPAFAQVQPVEAPPPAAEQPPETAPPAEEPATADAPAPDAAPPDAPATPPEEPGGEAPSSEAVVHAPELPTDGPSADMPPALEKPRKPYPRFETSARIMTGFERETKQTYDVVRDADGVPIMGGGYRWIDNRRYGWILRQVRLELQADLTKRIGLEISGDLADAWSSSGGSQPAFVRDAFMNAKLEREFQVTLGRFKRPFSRLELRGAGSLQIKGRGLTNGLVIEDNAWGSRAVGMMLWGKWKHPKLEWSLALTNPQWAPDPLYEGTDVIGRLAYEPVDGLEVGVNGGIKAQSRVGQGEYETYNGFGADIELEMGGVFAMVDAIYAELQTPTSTLIDQQTAMGVTGLVSYDIPINDHFVLQPVVFGELADASVDHSQTEAIRAVAGLNLIVDEGLRFMPQIEVVRYLDEIEPAPNLFIPWSESTAMYLLVSLEVEP